MCGRVKWCALALAAGVGMLTSAPALAANWLELNFWLPGPRYDRALPECHAATALNAVAVNFAQKEARFWPQQRGWVYDKGLKIVGYEDVREVAYRPWAPNAIPRRFCTAVALVTDGLKHPIHFSIGESTGMIGAGFGVEWCVVGLDRNWAYSPSCKMARP
jgi:hypothetical protein